MSLLDALFTRVGRPAGRALDPTIRDIVHAVLKEHGYASPAEVQALRDEVRDMRSRVDGMQRRVDEVVRQADDVRVAAAQSVAEAREGGAQAVAELAHKLAELQAQQGPTQSTAASASIERAAPAAGPSPLEAAPAATCKVADCETTVRSKGFCSPHYQQWRRGSLKGFVGPEGHVMGVAGVSQLSVQLAGGAVSVVGGKTLVDGKAL